jgi:hypothetical protein
MINTDATVVRALTADTIRALVRGAPAPIRHAQLNVAQSCELAGAMTAEAVLDVGSASVRVAATAPSVPEALELVKERALRRLAALTPAS